MNLSSVYSEIKELLSIPDENNNLEQSINLYFKTKPEEDKLEILGDILGFINKFSMFHDNTPLMNSLYYCINNTLEISLDSIYDFEELLIKNSVMHFIQEYINYVKIDQKKQVLNLLAESLERLELQPLVTNLCLLLKPLYKDKNYLNLINNFKEVEVSYDIANNVEFQVKNEIDMWLKSQNLDLDQQEKLKENLRFKFEELISKYNILKDSEKYKKLLIEVDEMLIMQLTVISLMDHIQDDSFDPIPIK
ncbi:MAG: hypothetical protein ACFFB0_10730 [Promethearchaeota archaeon]